MSTRSESVQRFSAGEPSQLTGYDFAFYPRKAIPTPIRLTADELLRTAATGKLLKRQPRDSFAAPK